LDALACGSLVALITQNTDTYNRLAKALWLFPLGIIGCIATAFVEDDVLYSAQLYTFLGLASTSVLCVVLVYAERPATKLLRHGALRYLGKISYALYLLHPVVIGLVRLAKLPAEISIGLVIGCSLAASALSWHFVESRLIALGAYLGKDRVNAFQ